MTVKLPQDDGPKFFTINQVVARSAGQAADAEATVPLWPLRLSHLGGGEVNANGARSGKAPYVAAGFQYFPSMNAQVTANWQQVQSQWQREQRQIALCEAQPSRCSSAASSFLSIIRQASGLTREEQVELVNARVNAAVRYQSDHARHGKADVWTAPLGTLGQSGDCEDYAIAKYHLLRQLGIPDEDLRIVVLRDRRAREDHAVLAVRASFAWHLLDNRYDTLDSDMTTAHYRPIIAINAQGQDLIAAPFAFNDDEGQDEPVSLRAEATLDGAKRGSALGLRGLN